MNRLVIGIARHWLVLFCLVLAAYIVLPVLAPILAAAGYDRASGVIYFCYRATCHQLPDHSWFLFGRQWAYAWADVQPFTGVDFDHPIMAFHHPIRNAEIGYQIAICQRDLAIWTAMLVTSAILAVRRNVPAPLSAKLYVIALLPIGIDGVTQLFGWRSSTPLLRTATGALFGAATALLLVPHLDVGFRDVVASLGRVGRMRDAGVGGDGSVDGGGGIARESAS